MTKTSADIRSNTVNGKTTSQDVQVTFGGLTWQVVHLTQDRDGNDILTLWLSSNVQDEFVGASRGTHYTISSSGALTSRWSGGSSLRNQYFTVKDTNGNITPTSMYSTSYIRTVTLNNGGSYISSQSGSSSSSSSVMTLSTATQSEDNVFAMFTMNDVAGSVTEYLVTPRKVAYQETENVNTQFGNSNYNPNEAYGTPGGSGSWYIGRGGAENITKSPYYTEWADDTLWLPSLTETGYSDDYIGIWNTSTTQRQNTSTNSWLRSGHSRYADYAYFLGASDSSGYYSNVYGFDAVRPALHLNLNAAASDAEYPPTLWDGISTEAPTLQNPSASNSETNPYIIDTAAKLAWISKNYLGLANGACFLQTEDLSLNNYPWTPINRGHSASYHYDGGNHTIAGLFIEDPSTSFGNYAGLFGSIRGSSSDRGYIKNLGLISGTVTGKQNVSALLGYGEYVDIINCYNNGVLVESSNNPSNAGGLVGGGENITITNSFNSANITGQDSVGGIAGRVTNSTISSCYNTGNISASYRSGGIAGLVIGGSVENTYNTGAISSSSYSGGIVGNLIGTSTLPTASVASSYSVGAVTGGNSGGIVGSTYCTGATSLTATDCYYNSETTNKPFGIGQGTSSGTTALLTTQMQGTSTSMNLPSTYWTFTAGEYPTLVNVVKI